MQAEKVSKDLRDLTLIAIDERKELKHQSMTKKKSKGERNMKIEKKSRVLNHLQQLLINQRTIKSDLSNHSENFLFLTLSLSSLLILKQTIRKMWRIHLEPLRM
jgi:hypothetical protein